MNYSFQLLCSTQVTNSLSVFGSQCVMINNLQEAFENFIGSFDEDWTSLGFLQIFSGELQLDGGTFR